MSMTPSYPSLECYGLAMFLYGRSIAAPHLGKVFSKSAIQRKTVTRLTKESQKSGALSADWLPTRAG
jgi:hypothetical protein